MKRYQIQFVHNQDLKNLNTLRVNRIERLRNGIYIWIMPLD